jgi:hypothetical protein
MLAWSVVRTACVGMAITALAVGCVVQDTTGGSGGGYGPNGPQFTDDAGSDAGPSSPSVLVSVDSNQTLTATPGNGVGVFVQYQTGGHWYVWWTCDTNKTGLPCAFDNTVSVQTGAITNPTGQTLTANDTVTQISPQSIEEITNTTNNVDGMTFDTPIVNGDKPIITLDVKLGGAEQCGYMFFVQDGKVNGGYQGCLPDPLMFEPSST